MTANVNILVKGDTSDAQRAMSALQGRISKVEAEAKQASSAMSAVGGGVSKLAAAGAAFASVEMAKKLFEMSDAALRGAGSIEGLSASARANAAEYVKAADKAKEQLSALIAEVSGPMMTYMATAATEAMGYWKKIFGIGVEGEQDAANDAANSLNNLNAQLMTQQTIMRKTAERRADLVKRGKSTNNIDGLITQQEQELSRLQGLVAEAKKTLKTTTDAVAATNAGNAKVAAEKAAAEEEKKRQERERKRREAQARADAKARKEAADQAEAIAGLQHTFDVWNADEGVQKDISKINLQETWNEQSRKAAQEASDNRMAIMNEEMAATVRNNRIQMQMEKDIRETKEANARVAEKRRLDELRGIQAQGEAYSTLFNGISALAARGDMQDRRRRIAWKAAAIAEATAATAVGFTKALEQQGPYGIITGIGVLAAGAAQIDTIRSQKFAQGGIVQGPSTGDRVAIRANGGEMVLTQAQQARLFAQANGGNGGGATITYAPVYQYRVNEAERMDDYRGFARKVQAVLQGGGVGRGQGALAW